MTLTLTPEQERRLTAYAKRKQKPVPAALDDLLPELTTEETPPSATTPQDIEAYVAARRAAQRIKNQGAIDLLDQWREEDAAMTDEEKEAATEQVNTFLANLQANRTRIGDEPTP